MRPRGRGPSPRVLPAARHPLPGTPSLGQGWEEPSRNGDPCPAPRPWSGDPSPPPLLWGGTEKGLRRMQRGSGWRGGTAGLIFLAPVQAGVPGPRGSQPLGGDAISSGGLWGKVVSEFSLLSSGISHTAPKQPSLLETVGITLKTVLGLLGSFSGQTFPSVDRSHF